MRIENPSIVEHLGSVRIHGVRRMLELDSGSQKATPHAVAVQPQLIEREAIEAIEKRMAIVLPIKNEGPQGIRGSIKRNTT